MEPFQEALAVLITDTPTPVRNEPVNDTHIATFTELDTVNEINEASSEQEVRRAIVEARFQEYIKDPGEDKPTIPEWQKIAQRRARRHKKNR